MKFTDFSTPSFLIEAQVDQIKDDLSAINKEVDVAAKADPSLAIQVKGALQKLLNYTHKVLSTHRHQSHEEGTAGSHNTPMVMEDVQHLALINELEDQILQIRHTVPNPETIIAPLQSYLAKLRESTHKLAERSKDEGYQQAQKEQQDFMKAIDDQLKRLAEKIDGHVVRDWQSPTENGKKMNKNEKAKEKTRAKVQSGLMDLFDSLFRNYIKSGKLTQDEALNFAKAAADGEVIDMRRLVNSKQGHGLIDDYVNPTHKKVYDVIIDKLLTAMPAGTGGNVGPGELALAALGNPTEKAIDKGDLIIDGVAYEIKGGNSNKAAGAQTGGRLNGTKIQGAKAAHAAILNLLKKEHKTLYTAMLRVFQRGDYVRGKTLIPGITESGTINWEKGLNEAGYSKNQTVNFFHDMLATIVSNYDEVTNSKTEQYYNRLLDAAIQQTEEGVGLDYRGLMKAITFIQHNSYKTTDKFDHIMLLNKGGRSFTIINDGQDFVNKIDAGTVIPTKGLSIVDNDPQTATFHWTSK
mgnify:CR=1 FL=1